MMCRRKSLQGSDHGSQQLRSGSPLQVATEVEAVHGSTQEAPQVVLDDSLIGSIYNLRDFNPQVVILLPISILST